MDKLLPSYLYRCLWPVIALYAGAMIMAVPAEQPWVRSGWLCDEVVVALPRYVW